MEKDIRAHRKERGSSLACSQVRTKLEMVLPQWKMILLCNLPPAVRETIVQEHFDCLTCNP